jgi:hypothetical protein
MTDRELLELAAKAAGYASWDFLSFDCDRLLNVYDESGTQEAWNPLEDDGDALRLASYLCMTVRHEDPAAVIAGWSAVERVPFTRDGLGPWHWKEWLRDNDNDRTATTRRAIVRAAAAIAAPR